MYILELHMSGERVHIEKYLFITKDSSSLIHFTERLRGEWVQIWSTRTNVDWLRSFFDTVPSSTEDREQVGVFLIITNIAGEEMATRVYDKLPQERYRKLLQTLPYPRSE